MKNTLIFSIVSLIFLFMSSCVYETIRPDNKITTRTVSFSEYSGLRVSDAFDVYIVFSDHEERISIEANRNIQDYIEVGKKGDYLNISLKNHTRLRGDVTLTAHITTRLLTHFDVSGASQLYLNNKLESENVAIELSGASGFSGEVYANYLNLEGSGASTFDLSGSIGHLESRVSGASTVMNFDLYTDQLDLKLSGASNAYLTVRELIDFKGSGASTLYYKGDALLNKVDVSGASQIVNK